MTTKLNIFNESMETDVVFNQFYTNTLGKYEDEFIEKLGGDERLQYEIKITSYINFLIVIKNASVNSLIDKFGLSQATINNYRTLANRYHNLYVIFIRNKNEKGDL